MIKSTVEEIEHTADWAIRVRAADLPGLFIASAKGMFGLLADLAQITICRHVSVELHAIDFETLLIDWLNELLYLSEQHGVIFVEFAVEELSSGNDVSLRAHAAGGSPAELFKVIKAATFSGLTIRRVDDAFQAELVFDV